VTEHSNVWGSKLGETAHKRAAVSIECSGTVLRDTVRKSGIKDNVHSQHVHTMCAMFAACKGRNAK
jgi:hypothetical protein